MLFTSTQWPKNAQKRNSLSATCASLLIVEAAGVRNSHLVINDALHHARLVVSAGVDQANPESSTASLFECSTTDDNGIGWCPA